MKHKSILEEFMKRTIAFVLLFLFAMMMGTTTFAVTPVNNEAEKYKITPADLNFDAKSVLLMEAETGEILFSQNENEELAPASVTKIMTLLLVMEALDDGRISADALVPISANAASMGGSQVFLKEGEEISVKDLIKCTVIASANDAAVALSEYIYGTEESFVKAMNKKAQELGMKNSNFENTTGLDDTTVNHVTSALDIAIMSRALLSHKFILEYSSLWQDSIRNGAFTLTNTNRLVRYYDGCNGLKTGSTDKAGYCISATAQRDGMQLIAVVMGAESRDSRNNIARAMLDFGFSSYSLYKADERAVDECDVYGGSLYRTTVYCDKICKVINKNDKNSVEIYYELPDFIEAPLKSGDTVGRIKYMIGGRLLAEDFLECAREIGKVFVAAGRGGTADRHSVFNEAFSLCTANEVYHLNDGFAGDGLKRAR
jgi:D-alanyl-D-alanine carboxypeptidase (penicillin-binding protein 5/6)